MAQESLLVSFVLGVALLAVVVVFLGRGWRDYTPVAGWSRAERRSVLSRGADSPAVWTAAFVVLAVGFGMAAVLYVGGSGIPEGMAAVGGAFLVTAATLVFTLYVFYGTFVSAKNRGLKNSQAALLGAWAIGSLLVVAITVKLLGLF